ncbi:hypothetical protein O2W15_11460 [Modestobacter sp. VKM Ac-2979]|uniref:hypothetical protein n=1 Tax=unclassified Modestobacter TaxID=2643866 RepID=UPI0022ABC48A|nr:MULTISPECIES: hypothetical protein [unclassified Modestobacter]MCZ2812051.1 hypothetical protein [Modestobacter sp. VKM Ac-2979]MCZ2843775.1 hypothetical protein [Modestobacter sp. VKM Ac-2980]
MTRTGVLLLVALVVAGVGVVDAARAADTDLVVLLTAVLVLMAAALGTEARHRSAVVLRPDLAQWLRLRAGATGETVDRLADRCVAACRAGLVDDTSPAGTRP